MQAAQLTQESHLRQQEAGELDRAAKEALLARLEAMRAELVEAQQAKRAAEAAMANAVADKEAAVADAVQARRDRDDAVMQAQVRWTLLGCMCE